MVNPIVKVSVIIPTYNPGDMLLETLNSLVSQSYKNFEVILSDDGSSDNTVEIAKSFQSKLNLTIVNNKNSGGPAKPRNTGIKKASGEWIAFLDHDDTWYPEKLFEVSKYFDKYDVIYHDLDIINSKSEITGKTKLREVKGRVFVDLVVNGNAIANSGAITKRSLIENANYVEESKDYIAGEDFDLWIKISKVTSKFYYIKKSLGQYRVEKGLNLSQPTVGLIKVHERILNRYKELLTFSEQVHATANVSYKAARMYHDFKMYSEAWHSYRDALKSNDLRVKIKAIVGSFFLLLSKLKIH